MSPETEYEITTDQTRFDVGPIHEFLANSYWAKGIPRDVVERSIQNALAFGVFHQKRQAIERDAWMTHVLQRAETPDFDGYLAATRNEDMLTLDCRNEFNP